MSKSMSKKGHELVDVAKLENPANSGEHRSEALLTVLYGYSTVWLTDHNTQLRQSYKAGFVGDNLLQCIYHMVRLN